jgi:hypothetical protein
MSTFTGPTLTTEFAPAVAPSFQPVAFNPGLYSPQQPSFAAAAVAPLPQPGYEASPTPTYSSIPLDTAVQGVAAAPYVQSVPVQSVPEPQATFSAPVQADFGAPQPASNPNPPQQSYNAPQPITQPGYGAPPQQSYGVPQPAFSSAPPQPSYGAPAHTTFGIPPPQPVNFLGQAPLNVNLPAPTHSAGNGALSCFVVEAQNISADRIYCLPQAEKQGTTDDGKPFRTYRIPCKYLDNKGNHGEFFVKLPTMTAKDGVMKKVFLQKTKEGQPIMDPATGKQKTNSSTSITAKFERNEPAHVACVKGLNIASRALTDHLAANHFRVGIGKFDPSMPDGICKPIIPVPLDKNTGHVLDVSPSTFLKVNRGSRTLCYWDQGDKIVPFDDDEYDLICHAMIVYTATVRIDGLFIGANASIQWSVDSLCIHDIGLPVDPEIYKTSGGNSAAGAMMERVAKMKADNAARSAKTAEQNKKGMAEASISTSMIPGGNMSGVFGGQGMNMAIPGHDNSAQMQGMAGGFNQQSFGQHGQGSHNMMNAGQSGFAANGQGPNTMMNANQGGFAPNTGFNQQGFAQGGLGMQGQNNAQAYQGNFNQGAAQNPGAFNQGQMGNMNAQGGQMGNMNAQGGQGPYYPQGIQNIAGSAPARTLN